MNKISTLLNYLNKSSSYEEWSYLFKLANNQTPEEYLKESYPNVYEIFLKESRPAPAWISVLNQLNLTKEDISNLNIQSFVDLTKLLKERKSLSKDTNKKRFFKGIKNPDLTEELKDKIISYGIPKDVFLYLYNQEQHTLDERVEMYNSLKPKMDAVSKKIPEFDLDIRNYETLDEFSNKIYSALNEDSKEKTLNKFKRYYNYIWDGEINENAPEGTYDTYGEVDRGGAKANSEVIAELPNHIVVHSRSKEAVQYWERGAVNLNEDGSFEMKTCTSRVGDPENFGRENYYDHYEGYDIYQIIRKDAIKDGAPMLYNEVGNPGDHLVTMAVDNKREIQWGNSETVNAEDESIEEGQFESIIGEENYLKFLDIIGNNLTSINIVDYALEERTEEEKSKIISKVKEFSPYDFFKNKIYEIAIVFRLDDIFNEKLNELSPLNYFKLKAYDMGYKSLNNKRLEEVDSRFFAMYLAYSGGFYSLKDKANFLEKFDNDAVKRKIKSMDEEDYINVFKIYASNFPDLFDQEDAYKMMARIDDDQFKRYLSAWQPNNTDDIFSLLVNLSDRKAALDVVFSKAVEMDAFEFFEVKTYLVLAQLTLFRSGERPARIDISKRLELISYKLDEVDRQLSNSENLSKEDLSEKLRIFYDDIYHKIFDDQKSTDFFDTGAEVRESSAFLANFDGKLLSMAQKFANLAISTGEKRYVAENTHAISSAFGFQGFLLDPNFTEVAEEILGDMDAKLYFAKGLAANDNQVCITLKKILQLEDFEANLQMYFMPLINGVVIGLLSESKPCESHFSEEEKNRLKEMAKKVARDDVPEYAFFQFQTQAHRYPLFIDTTIKHLEANSPDQLFMGGGSYIDFATLKDMNGTPFTELSEEYKSILDEKQTEYLPKNDPLQAFVQRNKTEQTTFEETPNTNNGKEETTFDEDYEDVGDLDF